MQLKRLVTLPLVAGALVSCASVPKTTVADDYWWFQVHTQASYKGQGPVSPTVVKDSDERTPFKLRISMERETNDDGSGSDGKMVLCTTFPGPFDQASLTRKVRTANGLNPRCLISFKDYVPFAGVGSPVGYPSTACVSAFVSSPSGVFNHGRGKIDCEVQINPRPFLKLTPDAKPATRELELAEIHPYATGYYESHLTYWPSVATVQLPLDWMNLQIFKALSEVGANGDTVQFKVIKAEFDGYSSGQPNLSLHLDVDGKILGAIDFRCDVQAGFALPTAPLLKAKVQSLGVSSACGIGGDLWQPVRLNEILAEMLASALEKTLDRVLFGEAELADFGELTKKDRWWASVVLSGRLQAAYCASPRWPRGFCLHVGWKPLDLQNWFPGHAEDYAPKPQGTLSLTKDELTALSYQFIANAPLKADPSPYPAKRHNGVWDDDDSTIFGGLLCAAGVVEGCRGVAASQGSDGAFWRSPAQVDVGTNPFTGDQMTGVLNYLAHTAEHDPVEARKSLRGLLTFLRAHRAAVPTSAKPPIDFGYKACAIADPNDNCLVGAAAWFFLNKLASKLSSEDLIPPDMSDVSASHGYSPAVLAWEATIAPPGYRMHLIGVYVFLARQLGISSPELDKAAMIMAAREPENPFYLFLHLGSDERVLRAVQSKCAIDPAATDFGEWAWERASADEAWKTSMRWDCAFMYSLLAAAMK